MPDISMCLDKACPSRMTCYRYRAKPTEGRQAYAGFKHKGERCESYQSVAGWSDWNLRTIAEIEKMEGGGNG
jgi:hypothetical protein